jgi:hypothetical protein
MVMFKRTKRQLSCRFLHARRFDMAHICMARDVMICMGAEAR